MLRLLARSCLAPSRLWRAAVCVFALGAGVTSAAQGSAAAPPAAPAPAAVAAPPPPKGASGAELYARYCKLCHGPGGKGYAADNAPSLVSSKFLGSASDEYIGRGIRFGRPETSMAAYGKERGGPLDDTQIVAIVAFLRAKGPAAAALPEQARTLIVELADNHARHVWLQQEGAYHFGLAAGRRLKRST